MNNNYFSNLEKMMTEIKLKLLKQAPLSLNLFKALNSQITISQSSFVNANSSVQINLGMLNIVENEDELAGVIAHELAHRLLDKDEKIFGIKNLFKDNRSQENELEADRLGTYLIHKSGYNPFAVCDILTRIQNYPEYNSADEEKNKHPSLHKRIEMLLNYITENKWERGNSINSWLYKSYISFFYFKMDNYTKKHEDVDVIFNQISHLVNHNQNANNVIKSERVLESLSLLSKVFLMHQDVATNFRTYRFSCLYRENSFLGGVLKVEKPVWLDDALLFNAKIFSIFEDIGKLLLSVSPFVGDLIGLYELLSGKSFFDGKELNETERVFSGIAIIVGSRKIFEGISQVVRGIINDFKVTGKSLDALLESERILKAITDLDWSGSKEAIYDLSIVIPELKKTGKLPSYYVLKEEAIALGWIAEDGNLSKILPGRQIGGNVFKNSRGLLPSGEYFVADVGYRIGFRGNERIIYSSDGSHIFLTNNHFESFIEIK